MSLIHHTHEPERKPLTQTLGFLVISVYKNYSTFKEITNVQIKPQKKLNHRNKVIIVIYIKRHGILLD